ncbi:hypothetical protein ACI7RC_17520 [Brevibacillus sp. B_LB10_24]|uniref:hypothetical protein n=1 Tax=Brevibacillus sp. B_LB10_24 TaxID=3380645 RepID=UPI0038BA682E
MKWDGLLIAICLCCMAAVYLPFGETSATPAEYRIDISTNPGNGFLSVKDLKPGDSVKSTIHVNNDSNTEFAYTVTANWENGSKALYNLLQLTIADQSGIRYQGLLTDLKQLPIGEIDVFKSDSLVFTATLPAEMGNEYQGLMTKAALVFQAEPLLPKENLFLPPFGNDQFSHQQGSTTPISFSVNGTNIMLKVTGPAEGEQTQTYLFQLNDGTLKKEGNYYKAEFSGSYPAGEYAAVIYDGDRVLGKKTFRVAAKGSRSNTGK